MMATMTTPTMPGTTDPASPRDAGPSTESSRRGRGLSVRTRLAAAISALVLVALASAGALLWLIGDVLIDRRIAADADQEVAEFTSLQEIGLDPSTGEPVTSVRRLVELYLERNVPSSSELLVGYWGGRPRLSSASDRMGLLDMPAFSAAIEPRVDTGGTTRLDTRWGEVHLDVLPLRDARIDDGAFVVAFFVADERGELVELVRTYAVVAGLALLLVTVVAYVLSGRLLSPLRELRDTALEISESDLSRRIPERGNDDLTELTRTVNDMLARLQTAFAGQRQLLDDAGHELRTPLTILRGHLELLDATDAVEVDRTRDLLLDETERMSRLVDDLILLTKADRPGFLALGDVDVASLTTGVLDKAVVLGERRWVLDGTADVVARLDEQRVAQAVLQLVDNAVRHTTDGGLVAVGSAYDRETDVVRLWVRDDGPGVPPEDRQRIFTRFTRLEHRQRDDEGFGLGLSIVAAIVAGHGGKVDVVDAEGGGARFEITLPRGSRERTGTPWRAS
jgi:two-component system OmpR family sensor kinase